MMPNNLSRQKIFETAIASFLDEKREKEAQKKQGSKPEKYNKPEWLENTAKILFKTKVQIATHLPKATHSDVQGGAIYVKALPERSEIGTHLLEKDLIADATGNGAENAAVLDGWNFLHLLIEIDGKKRFLKDWLADKDDDALAALSDVENKGQNIASCFLSFVEREEKRAKEAVSDGNAKQIYWLAEGEDALKNENFILLQPLYPTSLAHVVHGAVSEARYGEKAKEGREARKKRQSWDGILKEFKRMAQRSLGGSKPQNVSQLNSLRGGGMLLFSSAPPPPKNEGRAPLLKTKKSVLNWMMKQSNIRWILADLFKLLRNPPIHLSPFEIMNRRDRFVKDIVEELVVQAAEIRNSESVGWSSHSECKLPEAERLWLDTGRVEDENIFNSELDKDFRGLYYKGDWPDLIADRMAAFINHFLLTKGKLPVGDAEHHQWTRLAKERLVETAWPAPFQRKSKSQRDADLSEYREAQS